MQDPFIMALNTQKASLGWFQAISQNLGNIYTPGYREARMTFADFMNGVQASNLPYSDWQGKSIPGREASNLYIEGKGFFVMRKPDGQLRFTRLGDFKFNGDGTFVNELGFKVQGYLLGEDGKVLNTGDSETSGGTTSANNPQHSAGGPGHVPTTDVTLWVDPSNGKYFGKYDEYKVRSDGTVVGLANEGSQATPLYKIALVNFINQGGLAQPEDQMFTPTEYSGEPVEGTGEIRSGILEKSNVNTRDQVNFLQLAKFQLDVTAKLISTNKNLLEEALRLIQ
ncbi:MAG: flagellar hook-basal body complex protein [Vampirovibrionales bacterium]|nr:flagellar hook-basal body complex protein [Vampirovibrionales bacterium]